MATQAERTPSSELAEVNRLNLSWLVWLRWASIAGQSATILGVHFAMAVPLPLAPLAAIVAVEVLTNVACALWLRRDPVVRERGIALLIALDLLLFTGLLYLTGGPTNPFSSLYLIHLALAALAVGARYTWALVGLTLACSAALFLGHVPLEMGGHDHAAMGHYGMHLKGMWVALGVSACFIVYFRDRLKRALVERELELRRARERTARQERLAGLAALAAGAAHELASPLATIAVVAKELERSLAQEPDARRSEDARLIRSEVGRCSDILAELAVDAGQARGEPPSRVGVRELVAALTKSVGDDPRVSVELAPEVAERQLELRTRLFTRALKSVLDNALDASGADGKVRLGCDYRQGRLSVEVSDDGPGMDPDVRARALDPFFSTKPEGQGMGLGLFLAASVAEQLGGELTLVSETGRGTRVTVEVPA